MPNTWNTQKQCWIDLHKNQQLLSHQCHLPKVLPKTGQNCVTKWSGVGTTYLNPHTKLTLSEASEARRLVARVCSLWWAMFLSAARLRRVIACFRLTAGWLRESTAAGTASSQAFSISTAVIPITQRSNAPGRHIHSQLVRTTLSLLRAVF